MRHTRRTVIKGMGTAGVTVGLAGCIVSDDSTGNGNGNGSDGGSSTQLWHTLAEGEADLLETYIAQFEEETDHDIAAEEVSELNEQLNTSLPVGEGPDIFTHAHDWVGPFEDRGWLYDVSDDLTIDIDETYTDTALEAATWQDGVYGLPYAAETVGLLYNRDLVDSPPETLDEMVEVMEDHHDPDDGQYGVAYPLADPYFASAWIHAFGGYLYDDEADELGHELDETIEGVELLVDSFWPYAAADPSYESQIAVFNDGNAPFVIVGPWEVSGFRDSGIDVGIARLPTVDGGDPSPYTGVQLWYFTQELEDGEALATSREFAEWYTTTDNVILSNADELGYIPVHADLSESDELSDEVAAFAENVSIGEVMPTSPKMERVWEPTRDALERILNGEEEARPAFEQAAEEIRAAWEENDL
ncbi:extracellular solute-binding protein [Halopiger xanaduensis]|uniref:Extracellular solute-binding protein family 1 n=1 Tax=Halopiger xanaduensis (strain DSM 18323 / JCM 14033 / SH-6) TaxID=797210 RepID=F8D4X1_HALXS|nr:extracellular solute-binding protein [Halopiger xanaduensis]AEH38732.1 extracellular solute-binding protein family 1 [Halopiger xanaduensis SH-6]